MSYESLSADNLMRKTQWSHVFNSNLWSALASHKAINKNIFENKVSRLRLYKMIILKYYVESKALLETWK